IRTRAVVADGMEFGTVGPYEKIAGRFHFSIDPSDAANGAIRDIAHAPVTRRGLVEFSADFYLLKPVAIERGNGVLLFEVANRGGKGILPMFAGARSSRDPTDVAHFGDGFFQLRGDTLLWVGCQFNAPANEERLRAYVPAAEGVSGLVRSDFVVRQPVFEYSLGDRNHRPYPAIVDDANATMTVRDSPDG